MQNRFINSIEFRPLIILFILIIVSILVGLIVPSIGISLSILIVAGPTLVIVSLRSPFAILCIVVFLIPLGFFTMISGATYNRYLSVILLVSLVIDIFQRRKPFHIDTVILMLGAWIFYGLLSYLWSPSTNRLRENFFGYLLVFILLVSTVYLVNNRKRLSWVLGAFLGGQFLYVVVYLLSGETNVKGYFLPTLGSSQLSEYGTWIGLIIACFVAVAFYSKSLFRIFSILVLAFSVYLFFTTGLRRTILTTAVVVVALLFFQRKIPWKAIILAVILFSILWFAWDPILSNLPLSIQRRFTIEDVVSTGGTGRVNLYKFAFDLWLSHPVFGVGLGNYAYYADPYFGFQTGVPHNVYLEVLCETGLVGFILWVGAFISIFWKTIKTFRYSVEYPDQLLASVPLALLAYMFAGGMVDSMQNWRPLWFAMGLGIALVRIKATRPQRKTIIPESTL